MGFLVNPYVFAESAPSLLEYTDTQSDTTNLASYSFAGVNFGAASGNRRMFVSVQARAAAAITLSSATIGGVSADVIAVTPDAGIGIAAIITATVPTGTSGTVAVTFGSSALECRVSAWKSDNGNIACIGTREEAAGSGAGSTITLKDMRTFDEGFIISSIRQAVSGNEITTAWGGSDGVTSDHEADGEATYREEVAHVLTTEETSGNDIVGSSASSQAWAAVATSWAVARSAPPVCDFLKQTSTPSSENGSGEYTFTAVPFAEPASDRLIIVGFAWVAASARTISSVTIGGVTASLAHSTLTGTAGGTAIYYANVTSGSYGDVVITMNATVNGIAIGTYRGTPGTQTPLDAAGGDINSGTVTAADVEVADGGFGIAVGHNTSSGSLAFAYNGTDTEVADSDEIYVSSRRNAFGHVLTTEAATTNDFTFTAASSRKYTSAASWV